MEDEDGYMALGKRGAAGSPRPLQDAGSGVQDPQGGFDPWWARVLTGDLCCPRCLLGALMAALVLSLVACVSWLVFERGQLEGTVGCGNASLGWSCADLGCIYLGLRKSLCALQEGEGCKLCPMGWTLHRTKCYWVADEVNPWNQSKQDCVKRSAELLMPGDQEELGFLNEILQKPNRYFWIGLSIPSAGKGWTWLNGSRLDQSRFQLSPGDKGRSCGVLREDRISSDNCSSALQWICQKEATQL
ncbi:killer cell lectin-like receptor subfamily F member 1 [Mycteria americana]|uniref:killer cell lectin-like receptor subfamily F member 1 n=1 Tax=Mycteria americana TaxID=33587 RepID=UPI003F58C590